MSGEEKKINDLKGQIKQAADLIAWYVDERQALLERIQQLEEALRRIHRECFDNLSAPKVLQRRALSLTMAACESVVEIPNFGAAFSSSTSEAPGQEE